MRLRKNRALPLFFFLVSLAGCHRSKQYETEVRVERISIVRRDESGNPTSTDFEISYLQCPGDQIEVMRGGEEFSRCIQSVKVGDHVKVKLVHRWDDEGHWTFDVHEAAGCKRPPDPSDDASFKMIRDCGDWMENGARVGFRCDYSDQKRLVQQCPWFKKR